MPHHWNMQLDSRGSGVPQSHSFQDATVLEGKAGFKLARVKPIEMIAAGCGLEAKRTCGLKTTEDLAAFMLLRCVPPVC